MEISWESTSPESKETYSFTSEEKPIVNRNRPLSDYVEKELLMWKPDTALSKSVGDWNWVASLEQAWLVPPLTAS